MHQVLVCYVPGTAALVGISCRDGFNIFLTHILDRSTDSKGSSSSLQATGQTKVSQAEVS